MPVHWRNLPLHYRAYRGEMSDYLPAFFYDKFPKPLPREGEEIYGISGGIPSAYSTVVPLSPWVSLI